MTPKVDLSAQAMTLSAERGISFSNALSAVVAGERPTGVTAPVGGPSDETWSTILDTDRPRADRILRALGVERGLGYVEALDQMRAWNGLATGYGDEPPVEKVLKAGGLSLAALEATAIRLHIGSVLPGSTEAIRLAQAQAQAAEEDVDDFGRVLFAARDRERQVSIVAGDDLALAREYLAYREVERHDDVGGIPLSMNRQELEERVQQWATTGRDLVGTFAREQRLAGENVQAARQALARRRQQLDARDERARELREEVELGEFLEAQRRG